MFKYEPVVDVQPFIFCHKNAFIIEGKHAAGQGRKIHTKGSAGLEIRIKAVFGCGLQILCRELFLIFIDKPLVGNFSVPKILSNECSTINDCRNAVFL